MNQATHPRRIQRYKALIYKGFRRFPSRCTPTAPGDFGGGPESLTSLTHRGATCRHAFRDFSIHTETW
jgi:hypothetical protein